jgi:hypothetical protein
VSLAGVVLAVAVAAQPAPERLKLARSSSEDMAGFAAARVCLPIVQGRSTLEAAVKGQGFPWKPVPGAFALYGTTPNQVKVDDRGGCYFRIDHGGGPKLREAVLGALKAADAGPLEYKAFDAGPGSRDARGKLYRQESYCLGAKAANGEPLGLVISSGEGPGPVLQMSLFASGKHCAPEPGA